MRTDVGKAAEIDAGDGFEPSPASEEVMLLGGLPHRALSVGGEYDGAEESVRLLTERARGVRGVAEQRAQLHLMAFFPGSR